MKWPCGVKGAEVDSIVFAMIIAGSVMWALGAFGGYAIASREQENRKKTVILIQPLEDGYYLGLPFNNGTAEIVYVPKEGRAELLDPETKEVVVDVGFVEDIDKALRDIYSVSTDDVSAARASRQQQTSW